MKQNTLPLLLLLSTALAVSSCRNYRYYHPAPVPFLFKGKMEFQGSAEFTSSGQSVKAGMSLTRHLAIAGQYNNAFFDYQSKDFESALGFHWSGTRGAGLILGGYGWGNNFKYTDSTHTSRYYMGKYTRPFLQLNYGITGGKIYRGITGEIMLTFMGSYFMYNGNLLDASHTAIKSSYGIYQTGFVASIGSRTVQFYVTNNFAYRLSLIPLSGSTQARTFPVTSGVGLKFIIGRPRHTEDATPPPLPKD